MTYNQLSTVALDVNHYVDIEITEYRVLYCESIAGRGIARLISWLATAGQVDCINRVFDCYIRVYQFYW